MYDEAKFKEFNRLLQEARADLVVVNHPQVLGCVGRTVRGSSPMFSEGW